MYNKKTSDIVFGPLIFTEKACSDESGELEPLVAGFFKTGVPMKYLKFSNGNVHFFISGEDFLMFVHRKTVE